jgi:wyosine [tRNA(Phe)-imidazoG37] synthetase (radical SAM superfamily)
MMFVEANKDYAPEMARLAEQLSPDEVQLNTPLRPCTVNPLSPEDISAIRQLFSKFRNVVTVYKAPRTEVPPLNLEETRRRRQEKEK